MIFIGNNQHEREKSNWTMFLIQSLVITIQVTGPWHMLESSNHLQTSKNTHFFRFVLCPQTSSSSSNDLLLPLVTLASFPDLHAYHSIYNDATKSDNHNKIVMKIGTLTYVIFSPLWVLLLNRVLLILVLLLNPHLS